jgi:hypothetical protein
MPFNMLVAAVSQVNIYFSLSLYYFVVQQSTVQLFGALPLVANNPYLWFIPYLIAFFYLF